MLRNTGNRFSFPGVFGIYELNARVSECTDSGLTDTPGGYIMRKKDTLWGYFGGIMNSNESCCECGVGRKKRRTQEEVRQLTNRLNRIEGQIRGIKNMLDGDAYCPEILNQVAAANAALNAFGRELLAAHIRTCVAQDIREGHDETIEELLKTLQKLMK